MKLLRIKIWVCAVACMITGYMQALSADTAPSPQKRSYEATAIKAQRFFKYREWPNAAAMYELMLEEQPKNCDTYAHAIVVAGMRSMPDYEIALAEKAQANLVPVDSLLHGVQRVSFSLGETSQYEKFLLLLKERQPWLGRSIDKQLLRYYLFRRNGPGIEKYSRIMLSGAPGNPDFMLALAQGQLLNGHYDSAMATYKELIGVHPDNYTALLYLGNYYKEKGDSPAALEYLRRAQAVKATPYVAEAITGLDRGGMEK